MTTKLPAPKTPSTKPTAPSTKRTPMSPTKIVPDKIRKEHIRTY